MAANSEAFGKNAKLEYERNYERYKFLKWGQSAFSNFKVVPPDTGNCSSSLQYRVPKLAQKSCLQEKDGKEVQI